MEDLELEAMTYGLISNEISANEEDTVTYDDDDWE